MKKNNLKKIVKLVTLTIGLLFYGHFASAEALNLPKDENGWTIFTPSDDSRIIYIDPVSGNDSTGTIYDDDDAVIGADPFNPVGVINAFATFTVAIENARHGYPDWVLLKRGTTLRDDIGGNVAGPYTQLRAGRSATEPSLFGTYGTGAIPVVEIGPGGRGLSAHGSRSYMAISGIYFYSYTRDPNNPNFTIEGWPTTGISWLSAGSSQATGRLVEGCQFRFFHTGANIQTLSGDIAQGAKMDEFVLYRTAILDSYDAGGQGHSQGIFVSSTGLHIDECIFDHNGWYSQNGTGELGPATIFNHNIYMGGSQDVKITNTISLRPSSIHVKEACGLTTVPQTGPTVTNNLMIDGEVGVSIWVESADPSPQKDTLISSNVISNLGRSRPTNRSLAWYIDIAGIDGVNVLDNLMINDPVGFSGFGFQTRGYLKDTIISRNTIYNAGEVGLQPSYDGSNPLNPNSNILFNNNIMSLQTSGDPFINAVYNPSPIWTFSGNQYYTPKADGTRFRINGVYKTNAQWTLETGDDFTFGQPSFVDPARSIETYMQSIGETGTIDAFIEKVRAQNRYNWDTRLTAETVNAWIKAGFVTDDIVAPSAPTGLGVL